MSFYGTIIDTVKEALQLVAYMTPESSSTCRHCNIDSFQHKKGSSKHASFYKTHIERWKKKQERKG